MTQEAAFSLLLIALSAFLSPIIFRRIGVPAAVGEIVLGIILGNLGLVSGTEFVDFLAQLGLILLMFMAGYEIDFEAIESEGPRGILPSLFTVALIFGICGFASWYFKLSPVLFLVMSAMSIGLGAALLKEMGLSRARAGQAFLLVGSIGELATIVILSSVLFYNRFGLSLSLVYSLSGLIVIFIAAYLVLIVLRGFVWWFPETLVRLAEAYDSSEIGVRAGLALAFVFVGIAAIFGIEPLLGAFIAGGLFGFVFRDKESVEPRFSAIGYGFLIPIFFINVGVHFRLAPLFQHVDGFYLLGIIGGIVILSRLLASPILVLKRLSFREATGVGFLMAAPLSLQVVAGDLGLRVGAIDKGTFGIIVLSAMSLGLVGPIMGRLLLRKRKDRSP